MTAIAIPGAILGGLVIILAAELGILIRRRKQGHR